MVLGGIVLGEHFDGIDAATWRILLVGSTETCREIDVMHDVMLRMIVQRKWADQLALFAFF